MVLLKVSETEFRWINGEPLVVSNWDTGQHNNISERKCAIARAATDGQWRQANCGHRTPKRLPLCERALSSGKVYSVLISWPNRY